MVDWRRWLHAVWNAGLDTLASTNGTLPFGWRSGAWRGQPYASSVAGAGASVASSVGHVGSVTPQT
ncbi:Uncharacterised protein [uncultured archaeon]|nr:Uncharacterised protein [uncultured archaeon]